MPRSAGPYNDLPERAFWRRAVARTHHSEIDGLWDPAFVRPTDRIATGELAADIDDIAYFPGYELVAAHPSRGGWYEPDLRHVGGQT